MAHTPAPWIAREVTGLSIPGQRAFAIDFNEDQEQVVDWVYEEADAHLIAAAPDLLEALEALLDRVQLDGDSKNWFAKEQHDAMTAIAKARGNN